MALFFDAAWFDAKLSAVHLSRGDLARALGVSDADIAEMWKDQRELSAHHVTVMSGLLGASAQEIANHAGISTPVPQAGGTSLAQLDARMTRIEQSLEDLKKLVRELARART